MRLSLKVHISKIKPNKSRKKRAPKKAVAQAYFFGIEEQQRYLSLRSRLRGCMTISLDATKAEGRTFFDDLAVFYKKPRPPFSNFRLRVVLL